jgi:hypothetical protein
MLREALARFVKDASDVQALTDIFALAPGALDFGDDLFESFDWHGKMVLCSMLPILCPGAADRILEHRSRVDTDKECRLAVTDMLRRRRERAGGVGAAPCPADYPERTPEQRSRLRGLVLQYLAHRDDVTTTFQIQDLAPTDRDFDDELLDLFDPEARREIYATLLLWCGPRWLRKVLERRAKTETDQACKLFANGILSRMQG